jgi:hypothetical protein
MSNQYDGNNGRCYEYYLVLSCKQAVREGYRTGRCGLDAKGLHGRGDDRRRMFEKRKLLDSQTLPGRPVIRATHLTPVEFDVVVVFIKREGIGKVSVNWSSVLVKTSKQPYITSIVRGAADYEMVRTRRIGCSITLTWIRRYSVG